MNKKEFLSVLEATLIHANLGVIGCSLIDENTVQITFQGNGTRRVNIEADSFGAIILDIMKYVY